jgi:hypothetical protein
MERTASFLKQTCRSEQGKTAIDSETEFHTPANNKSNSDESKTADYVGTPRYLCPMLPNLTRVCWADMPCRLICLSAMDDDAFHGRLPNI